MTWQNEFPDYTTPDPWAQDTFVLVHQHGPGERRMGKKKREEVENTRARRNCVKALFLRSSVKRYGRVSRARVDFSSPSVSPTILHPPLTLAPLTRLFLAPIHRRLFTPWLLSFFQSRRCNDSNLEVRTRHTRRQPTPYLPSTSSHLLSLSLPFSLPLSLPLSLSFYHDERQRSKFFVLHKQRAFTTRIHLPRG